MDIILISFSICVLGVMVTVLLFAAAMRPEEEEEPQVRKQPPTPSEGFFLEQASDPDSDLEAPTNALLLELERHVRSEQQAAEAFLRGPNVDSLHAPSDSPPWN